MKEYKLETKKNVQGQIQERDLNWSNEPSTRGIPCFHVAECLLCQPGKPHLKLNVTLNQGCWNWTSSTLATWCEKLTHRKRPWGWGRLRTRGEVGDGGWGGWMVSLSQWTWVWASSGRRWRTEGAWHVAVHGVAKDMTYQLNNVDNPNSSRQNPCFSH